MKAKKAYVSNAQAVVQSTKQFVDEIETVVHAEKEHLVQSSTRCCHRPEWLVCYSMYPFSNLGNSECAPRGIRSTYDTFYSEFSLDLCSDHLFVIPLAFVTVKSLNRVPCSKGSDI